MAMEESINGKYILVSLVIGAVFSYLFFNQNFQQKLDNLQSEYETKIEEKNSCIEAMKDHIDDALNRVTQENDYADIKYSLDDVASVLQDDYFSECN